MGFFNVVGDWETNGNDSIVGICPCTSSVFLDPMLLLNFEDRFRIGVQL
jgi:hypothetical protein